MTDIKYITKEISFIKNLERTKQFKIADGSKLNDARGWLKKDVVRGYRMRATTDLDLSTHIENNLFLKSKLMSLIVKEGFLTRKHTQILRSSKKVYRHDEIKIRAFHSENLDFGHPSFCKEIIPIKEKTNFLYQISDLHYHTDDNFIRRGLLNIRFPGEKSFDAYITDFEEKTYLIIDSPNRLSPDDFTTYTWAIVVALSYVMGYLMQNESYIFYYPEQNNNNFNHFEYRQLRKSADTLYQPINRNPYGWNLENAVADTYFAKLTMLSQEHFSTLCNLVLNNIEIKGIILLILESSSSSLVVMPAGLSVALEGLTEYFSDKHAEILKPISDKHVSKSLKKDITELLLTYSAKIGHRGLEILQKKINDINNPTNAEKLKAPFKIYGITLTEIDEQVLNHRNDFLHGNINLKSKKGKAYEMDVFEISLRLITLLNIIILKMIGYEGFILNHVKLQERGLKKFIDEEPFREI